jgi:hypothetical protein
MLESQPLRHKIKPICSQHFPCFPMKSHAPSPHDDEMGSESQGRTKDPEQGVRQLHTGSPFHRRQRSGAGASRHLPQVARVAGRPAMGQRRIG